jgi:non-specific protein-tyrosine kinase
MNLRKALDKAKQMRGDTPPRPLTAGKPVVVAGSPDREWKPPEYTQSCGMQVQPAQLLENRCVCIAPDADELEAYKVLRTRVQQATRAKGWNTILITSPNSGDGKTLTAINLALTFAKAYNQTVMLVDCDLRRQNVHRVLGIESASGIVDFLVDDKPLREFIIWPGIEKLTLISGGRAIQNSAEVLASARMKSLIQELKTRYDDRYVIIDAPPLLSGADTMALAPCVDCILMVVKESRTRMREIRKAIDMIPKEKFLGYVMNQQRQNGTAYYY